MAGDPAVRLALNVGVDRGAMVRDVLDGAGTAMSTLVSPLFGDAYDPAQDFVFDAERAKTILDEAGWRVGADGIRERDGRRARFDLAYYPTETLRRDLTMAATSDAKKIGIEINPVAVDKSAMTPQYLAATAFMLGGGGRPLRPATPSSTRSCTRATPSRAWDRSGTTRRTT